MAHITSKLYCNDHKDDECVSFCDDCKVAVCVKCITNPEFHQGHKQEVLEKGMKEIRAAALEEIDTFKSVVINYRKIIDNIKQCESEYDAREKNVDDSICQRAESLHKEVDEVKDKLSTICRKISKQEKEALSEKRRQLEVKLEQLTQLINDIEDDSLPFRHSVSSLDTYLESTTQSEFLCRSSTKFGFIPGTAKQPLDWFGELEMDGLYREFLDIETAGIQCLVKDETLSDNAESNCEYLEPIKTKDNVEDEPIYEDYYVPTTVYKRGMTRLRPGDNNSFWMANSGTREIREIDDEGITRTLVLAEVDLFDFAVCKKRNIFITEIQGQNIYKYPKKKRQWEPFADFKTPNKPNGICIANDDTVFVCLQNKVGGKVVNLSRTGTFQFEIAFEENYQQMFQKPKVMLQHPQNNDLCVVDGNKTVVVISKERKLRHRIFLDSTKRLSGEEYTRNAFVCKPVDLTVDKKGNLLISDNRNGKVYIFDQNGNYVDVMASNLPRVDGILSSADGRVWMSCDKGVVVRNAYYI